jgi:hypothetical protein
MSVKRQSGPRVRLWDQGDTLASAIEALEGRDARLMRGSVAKRRERGRLKAATPELITSANEKMSELSAMHEGRSVAQTRPV